MWIGMKRKCVKSKYIWLFYWKKSPIYDITYLDYVVEVNYVCTTSHYPSVQYALLILDHNF